MTHSSKFITSGMAPIRKVGRFLLYRELGRGAIGTVYFGHDPVIDRDVAIKIFHNLPTAQDKKQRDQIFMNEARAAGRLSHPNIITIFDAATEGNISYIAMEYLQGQDLRQFLADNKSLSFTAVAQMMQKIAEGLDYAHNEGVIHRDIKPANIFISENLQTKLVDFGIARAVKRETTTENNATQATLFNNNILGTPNYMSPEQAQARPVDKLTDVYSLGAVMYEVLTHQKPFQSRDMDTLLHMIVNKQIKAPHEINPDVPQALSRIVMRAMSKQSEKRYQSAAEMAQELRRFAMLEKRKQQHDFDPVGSRKAPEPHGRLFWISCIAITIAALVALSSWIK